MKTTGLWPNLERFAVPATVLAEWRMVLGKEFADAVPFLRVTQEQAEGYPCTNRSVCECRHEVVFHSPQNIVAACRCEPGECKSIRLEPKDLLIYALDLKKFCGAIARAFKFEAAPDGDGIYYSAPKIWPVGFYRHSPVYLALCPTDDLLLANSEGIFNANQQPFILFAPSQRNKTAAVQSFLQRHRCEFIPLSQCLVLAGKGRFQVSHSIQPILDRFTAGLADLPTIKPVLEGIRREIAAVAADRRDLIAAKTRLEQMQGEGLFGFIKKIDRESLDIFFTILAKGDLAKASRALVMNDSTLRSKVAGWRKRGKPYLALAEFVRWRKSINGEAGMEIAKRMVSGGERSVDHAGLLQDTLEILGTFNPDNWEEKCETLAELLRRSTS